MDFIKLYKKLAVKVDCINSKGSGVLYQPKDDEFSYVITAKHCLEGTDSRNPQKFDKNNIKIFFTEDKNKVKSLKVLDFVVSENEDLAVIKVEKNKKIHQILASEPGNHEDLVLYGFPEIYENDEEIMWRGQRLKCKLNDFIDKKIELSINPSLIQDFVKEEDYLVGLSGSGVFAEIENKIVLVGIFVATKSVSGAYGALISYDINSINELLKEHKMEELLPEKLFTFDKYIDLAFANGDINTLTVLKSHASKIKEIKPIDIMNVFKDNMYLPKKINWEKEILNDYFWIGWIKFLTYNYLDSDLRPIIINNNLMISRGRSKYTLFSKREQRIRFFYTESYDLKKVSYNFYLKYFEDISNDEIVVINTKHEFNAPKKFDAKDLTTKILLDISNPADGPMNVPDIDKSWYKKNPKFIHLNVISDGIFSLDSSNSYDENIKKIKKKIGEVYK